MYPYSIDLATRQSLRYGNNLPASLGGNWFSKPTNISESTIFFLSQIKTKSWNLKYLQTRNMIFVSSGQLKHLVSIISFWFWPFFINSFFSLISLQSFWTGKLEFWLENIKMKHFNNLITFFPDIFSTQEIHQTQPCFTVSVLTN